MIQDTEKDRHKRRRKPSAAGRVGSSESRRQTQRTIEMTTKSLDRIRV